MRTRTRHRAEDPLSSGPSSQCWHRPGGTCQGPARGARDPAHAVVRGLKRLHAMDRAASMEHAWTILSGDCLLRLIGSLESPCIATTAQTRAVLSMIAALARGCSEMRGEVRRVFSRIGGKRTAILLSSFLIPREKITLLHRLSTKASEADGALPASDPVAYASQPPAAIRADALAAIDACYREVGGGDCAEVPPPDDDTREGAEGVLVALVSYCACAISTNDAPTRALGDAARARRRRPSARMPSRQLRPLLQSSGRCLPRDCQCVSRTACCR